MKSFLERVLNREHRDNLTVGVWIQYGLRDIRTKEFSWYFGKIVHVKERDRTCVRADVHFTDGVVAEQVFLSKLEGCAIEKGWKIVCSEDVRHTQQEYYETRLNVVQKELEDLKNRVYTIESELKRNNLIISNPLIEWLKQHCEKDVDSRIEIHTLRQRYMDDTQIQISSRKFGRYMALLGYKSKVYNGERYYDGLRLRTQEP
jgi:hypothetical protein